MATGERSGEGSANGSQRPHAGGARVGDLWDGSYQFSQPPGSQLELREFSVRSLEASHIAVEKCAVGRARGGTLSLEQSAVGGALAKDIHIRQGAAAILAGAKVQAERSATQWLVGGVVEAKQLFAITVIAARVEGQVKCLFDARGAFAFGAGAALMTGLLRLLLFRRR